MKCRVIDPGTHGHTHLCVRKHNGNHSYHRCSCDWEWQRKTNETRNDLMNEREMYRVMMFVGMTLAVISGIGAVLMLIFALDDTGLSFDRMVATLLLGGAAVGGGYSAMYFGGRFSGHEKVFKNPIEQEVLTRKQRQELKHARGELVMQRSLVEIEHERDNIVHRQIEAANDPNKPPHQTRFNEDERPVKSTLYIEADD